MTSFNAFDMDLVVTFTAVFVAGLAAVLGIWMERDERKPPRYAWALSALILLATFVSLMQSFFDKSEQDALKDDMARLLTTMDRLATESDDPALLELVKSELNAQSRSDPTMVNRVAQRVSDEGRDPTEVLGKHLDAAEVEKVTRKGSIKAKETEKVARTQTPPEDAPRRGRERADKADDDTKESAPAPARPAAAPAEPDAARAAEIAAIRAARAAAVAPAGPPLPVPTPTVEATAAPVAPAGRPGARPGTARPVPTKGKRPAAPKKPKPR